MVIAKSGRSVAIMDSSRVRFGAGSPPRILDERSNRPHPILSPKSATTRAAFRPPWGPGIVAREERRAAPENGTFAQPGYEWTRSARPAAPGCGLMALSANRPGNSVAFVSKTEKIWDSIQRTH